MSIGTADDDVPPRVLHLTTSHLADDTRIFHKECRSLAEVGGYRVYLAAAGVLPSGSPVMHVPLPSLAGKRAHRLVGGSISGWALTRVVDFDILHLHDPELLPVGIAVARRGTPVIWDAHEDFVTRFSQPATASERVGRLDVRQPVRRLLAAMDRNAAGVVAATPSIAATYRNARTVVVGNEARLEDFTRAAPGPGNRQVLFTGQPTPYHLFPAVVEAVARRPELTLAIAGRGPTPDVLDYAYRSLGDRLSLLGWLDSGGLTEAMSASLVGVATLEDTPIGVDNSSNKVFEFAAGGLPSLMSPNPSNLRHDATGNHAYVASSFTVDGLVSALDQAVSDPQEWQERSARGRQWAREYGSWRLSETVLLELYGSVAGSARHAARHDTQRTR